MVANRLPLRAQVGVCVCDCRAEIGQTAPCSLQFQLRLFQDGVPACVISCGMVRLAPLEASCLWKLVFLECGCTVMLLSAFHLKKNIDG